MLVIRRDQMARFQAEFDRHFALFMVPQLRRRYPSQAAAYDDAALETEVVGGLAAARTHGIDDANAAARFVDARFRFGHTFDQSPRIRAILGNPRRAAVERVDAAVAALLAELA